VHNEPFIARKHYSFLDPGLRGRHHPPVPQHILVQAMQVPGINEVYTKEYLALIKVGATHQEAIAQISQSNEVEVSQVEINCAVDWAE